MNIPVEGPDKPDNDKPCNDVVFPDLNDNNDHDFDFQVDIYFKVYNIRAKENYKKKASFYNNLCNYLFFIPNFNKELLDGNVVVNIIKDGVSGLGIFLNPTNVVQVF